MKHIAIIGAGLTGLACAIYLAKRAFQVSVYEYRSAQEIHSEDYIASYGRAMSMDLSSRGIHALNDLGIIGEIQKKAVPMRHKIFHQRCGNLTRIPLGPTKDEHILAISRNHLFQTLMNQAKEYKNIQIHFRCKFIDVEFASLAVCFHDLEKNQGLYVSPDILIGADGSNSSVRKAFESYTQSHFETTPMPQSYKELSIPIEKGKFLEHHAMHFWSRDKIMLVAQPNYDQSFTCALLMAEDGDELSFNSIQERSQIEDFFREHFPDAHSLIPELCQQYAKNKANHLRILQGKNWTCCGNVLLIGDSAHGTVPFFGQGVNCCFEDCTVLNECLNETNNHWATALQLFEARRVKNANAMSTLSFTNYPELLHNNVFERALLKKQIEVEINQRYWGDYITYHNLVCFSRVPYTYAMACKRLQEPMLDRLSEGISNIDQLDWNKVKQEMIQYKKQLHNLNLNEEVHSYAI